MTTYSKSDLATRALKLSRRLNPDQVPEAFVLIDAIELIDSDMDAIREAGLETWDASNESIPDKWFVPMARYHSITLRETRGLMSPVDAIQARQLMLAELRKLAARRPTYGAAEGEYF